MEKEYVPFDYARAEKIAERTKAFYAGEKGKAQIHIKSCGSLKMPAAPKLNAFEFPKEMESYLDKVAERAYQFARFHEAIEDDFILPHRFMVLQSIQHFLVVKLILRKIPHSSTRFVKSLMISVI